MGPQYSPRRNDSGRSSVTNDGYSERSPNRNSAERPSHAYSESPGQSVARPERLDRRSRSPDRVSPTSTGQRIPADRYLSRADREREVRSKEAEEWKRSRARVATLAVSRPPKDDRSRTQKNETGFYRELISSSSDGQEQMSALKTSGLDIGNFPNNHSPINRSSELGLNLDGTAEPRSPALERPKLRREQMDRRTVASPVSRPSTSEREQPEATLINPARLAPMSGTPTSVAANTVTSESRNNQAGGSNPASNARLRITEALVRFMSEVTEQASLQLRRDSAEKALERKNADYEKSREAHANFPAAAEATKANRNKAQREFDNLDKELNEKRDSSLALVEEIANSWIPNNKDKPCQVNPEVDTKIEHIESKVATIEKTIQDLNEKFKEHRGDWGVVKNRQQQLDQLYRTSLKAAEEGLESVKSKSQSEFNSIRQEISAFNAKTSKFSTEFYDQNNSDLKSKIDTLSLRVDGFPNLRLELSMATAAITETLADHTRDLERLRTTVDERSESIKLWSSIEEISRNDVQIRSSLTDIQTRVTAIESEMKAAAERLQAVEDNSQLPGDNHILRPTLNEQMPSSTEAFYNQVREEMQMTQDAGDEFFGKSLEYLETRIEKVETAISTLKEINGPSDIEARISQFENSISSLKEQYSERLLLTMSDIDSLRDAVNKTASSLIQQNSDSSVIQRIEQKVNILEINLLNEIEALKMGYNNLDFRMNNLSTEQLARQILGQLETYRRNNDAALPLLDLRIQTLEKRYPSNEKTGIPNSMQQEVNKLINSNLSSARDKYVEANHNLLEQLTSLQVKVNGLVPSLNTTEGDINFLKARVLEDANSFQSIKSSVAGLTSSLEAVTDDLQMSKDSFSEDSTSLKSQINSIGTTLEEVMEDLTASKINFTEATNAIRADVAIAIQQQTILAEKRKPDSSQTSKPNGQKRRKIAKAAISSDDDA